MSAGFADLIKVAALVLAVGSLIRQVWAIANLMRARARAQTFLQQNDQLRAQFKEALEPMRSQPAQLDGALGELYKRLPSARDAAVLRKSINKKPNPEKVRFAQRLVAR